MYIYVQPHIIQIHLCACMHYALIETHAHPHVLACAFRMFICTYKYSNALTDEHKHPHVHTHFLTHKQTHTHTHAHTRTHVLACAFSHFHTKYTHALTDEHRHPSYTYTKKHFLTCKHTHTHTHTHTHHLSLRTLSISKITASLQNYPETNWIFSHSGIFITASVMKFVHASIFLRPYHIAPLFYTLACHWQTEISSMCIRPKIAIFVIYLASIDI